MYRVIQLQFLFRLIAVLTPPLALAQSVQDNIVDPFPHATNAKLTGMAHENALASAYAYRKPD
jgi:hypothetical protein